MVEGRYGAGQGRVCKRTGFVRQGRESKPSENRAPSNSTRVCCSACHCSSELCASCLPSLWTSLPTYLPNARALALNLLWNASLSSTKRRRSTSFSCGSPLARSVPHEGYWTRATAYHWRCCTPLVGTMLFTCHLGLQHAHEVFMASSFVLLAKLLITGGFWKVACLRPGGCLCLRLVRNTVQPFTLAWYTEQRPRQHRTW